MRIDRIAHLLVGLGIMVKRPPGAKNQLFVVLHADFLAQELHERDDGFFRALFVGDGSLVVRSVIEVGFPNADDQPVGERKLSKCLGDLGAEQLGGLRLPDIAEGLFDAVFFDQPLGKQHQIRLGEDGDVLFLAGFLQGLNLGRFAIHPCALLRAFGQNLGIDGFPIDGQRWGLEQEIDFAVVSDLLDDGGIVVGALVGLIAGDMVDHIQDERGWRGGGRGGS